MLTILLKVLQGKKLNPLILPLTFISLTILKLFMGLFLNFLSEMIQKNAKDMKAKIENDSNK